MNNITELNFDQSERVADYTRHLGILKKNLLTTILNHLDQFTFKFQLKIAVFQNVKFVKLQKSIFSDKITSKRLFL